MSTKRSPADEIDDLFEELTQLLKNADVITILTERGVNTSLALLGADGLHAYLRGDKARAADDLGDFADEVKSRLARAKKDAPS
jgi:hypothetical protein